MNDHIITAEHLAAYGRYLKQEEKSAATQEKYLRDITAFVRWMGSRPVTRENVTGWKEHLQTEGRAPTTINTALSALNGLFRFLGWEDCRAKFLKIQRRMFRDQSRELTRADYDRLITAAQGRGQARLALLMETICATGIRVSEVRYITVEAAKTGRAEITLKGKIRVILIPGKLCRKLLKYAKKNKTASGEIFLTGNREQDKPPSNLGGNEALVQIRRCRAVQGVPTQPAPLFRRGLLPGLQGYCETG